MRLSPTRNETWLLLAVMALAALAVFAPAIAQPPHLNDFADQRRLWGIPHAFDVLSNLPFALAGGAGLWRLRRSAGVLYESQRGCARLFFIGLLATAAASSYYHWAPDDVGLAFDRAGMSVAFAGLLGMAAAARVSDRAGNALALAMMVFGPASVAAWSATGNVLPWAIVQFGGMGVLLLVLAVGREHLASLPVRWSLVLLAYALAKLLEANDAALLRASGELLSGHTLKHVVAAFAALPVLAALPAMRRGQNGPSTVVEAA
jgi:hypothetical protein